MVKLFDSVGRRHRKGLLTGVVVTAVTTFAAAAQASPTRLIQTDELALAASALVDDELGRQRGAGLESAAPIAPDGAGGNDVAVILWDDYPDAPSSTSPGVTLSGNVSVNTATGH